MKCTIRAIAHTQSSQQFLKNGVVFKKASQVGQDKTMQVAIAALEKKEFQRKALKLFFSKKKGGLALAKG